MGETKHKRLNDQQIRLLLNLLDQHCTKGEDGYARYAEGWDDKRIANDIGGPVDAVYTRRLKYFGRVKNVVAPVHKPDARTEERLENIEDDINQLYRKVGGMKFALDRHLTEIEQRLEKLEQNNGQTRLI